VRAVLCYEVSDRNGPDAAAAGIEENRRFLAANRRRLVRGLFGAHAMFTLSDATIEACRAGAVEAGVGLHIHVAEDVCDREALRRFTPRPDDLLAHCVHADVSSIDAWVAHNPRSNMNNAVGHARLAGRARTLLGTDGIGGDMWAEAQAAFFRGNEAGDQVDAPGMLSAGRDLVSDLFGDTLEGDRVVTDYVPPAPAEEERLAGHLLFALNASRVRDVYVGGALRLQDRVVLGIDEEEAAAKAREAATRVWARMAEM
jgi:cytosine/adenosine deaminase-related metal-dependent hydrolase